MRSGIAQSFLESVNIPINKPVHHNGDPVDVNIPESGSCTCCCHCGRTDSWRASASRGHRRARSYTAPRTGISELTGVQWDPPKQAVVEVPKVFAPGESPLEQLPVEILGQSWKGSILPVSRC